MALTRNEGTSYIDVGTARVGASLGGIIAQKSGIFTHTTIGSFVTPFISGSSPQINASVVIPRGTLNSNGKSLRIYAWGTSAATAAATKSIQLIFTQPGATTVTVLFATGPVPIQLGTTAQHWVLKAELLRTGAATQQARGILLGNAATGAYGAASSAMTVTTGALFSPRAFTIALQVFNSNVAADVTMNSLAVEVVTEGAIPPII